MDCFVTPAEHKIFILGESLFAEGIAQILVVESGFEIVGRSLDIETVEKEIRRGRAKLVIVEGRDRIEERREILKLIIDFPDIRLIYIDVQDESIQLILSYMVQPKSSSILKIANMIQLARQ